MNMIVSWAVWGAVYPIYLMSKEKIKASAIFINIILGSFTWQIAWQIMWEWKYTVAICLVIWCTSMKIFEFVENNFSQILAWTIKNRTWLDLATNNNNNANSEANKPQGQEMTQQWEANGSGGSNE